MAIPFKNIIGTEFPSYVSDQLEARKAVIEKTNRDSKDLLWLTNRTGWYRATSGALIGGSDDLARKNILQGGLVTKGNQEGTVGLREGFDSSYIKGPLGFKPMPGITSLSVGTGGRWQTLLQGEIEFIAYDLNQLEILSKLYMSLGVHVFIEWGHKPFITGNSRNQTINTSSNIKPIDILDFPKGPKSRITLLQKISERKSSLEGNYGALLGRVYNFDYTTNPDGSYNCKIKVMGSGAMVDSLKGLSQYNGKDSDITPDEEPTKYQSDLENALVTLKNSLNHLLDPEISDGKGQILSVENPTEIKESFWDKIGNTLAGKQQTNQFGGGYYTKPSYQQVLNEIYSNANYKAFTFNGTTVDYKNNFAKFGNASQIIHQIDGAKQYGLSPLTYDFYKGYTSTLTYQKTGFLGLSKIKATYITLGHLFCLVQHLGIFVEKSGETQPAIYLDYHPDNTEVKVGALQASLDPSICLVPFIERTTRYNVGLGLFLNPLNINNTEAYDFVQGDNKPNNKKNFSSSGDKTLNVINGNIPSFDGKLFNILINIDFALNTLESIKQSTEDRVATLREYLQKILDGVNRALGKNNNFKIVFEDCSQTLRVIDENYIPESINYLELPVLGRTSIAYDYSYSSKISKELASQIVIASQAEDTDIKEFPEDVLTYFQLNGGVSDRFTDKIVPQVDCSPTTEEEKIKTLRSPQSLFDQLYNTYSLSREEPINVGIAESLINYYSNLQQKYVNIFSFSKTKKFQSGILIPLEMNITIDGISGIMPYNAFLLPNNMLPARYKNRVAFIVFSINHNFDNNKWTTTLRGQTIIRPEQSF